MRADLSLKHLALVIAATVLPLLPFLDKAFHIDDPLFIWTAKQILKEPLDFYGFTGNWFGLETPAYLFIKNPPLASYYIAVVGLFAGFSEKAMHIAFLVPAALASAGVYVLAARFTGRPLIAALATIATPGFLVSATTVMCDVMMLAFWAWAIVFWMKGVDENRPSYLAFGAVLVALAALTKYFGISLIPLLAAYSVMKGRKGMSSLLFLLVPIAFLAAYHVYTDSLYGRGLLLDASAYATGFRSKSSSIDAFGKAFVGLAFAGGCTITALFFLPSIRGRRAVAAGAAIAVLGAFYVYFKGTLGSADIIQKYGWGYVPQLALYASAGAGIIALVAGDLIKRRNAESALLALWVAGTLVFAVYMNWTINARSLLALVPAVSILIMRDAEGKSRAATLYVPLILSFAVSFMVARADYLHANSAREVSKRIFDAYSPQGKKAIWYRGHWGLQYYMDGLGARQLVFSSMAGEGELIVIPSNNTNIGKKYLQESFYQIDEIGVKPRLLNVMNHACGAGFYSNEWGALPFVIHPDCAENYRIFLNAS